MTYIQLLGGLIYLLMGADLLVRGAVALAGRARVTPLIVALSVVAFGTSLPELVVTVQAAWAGYPGLVIGNVVGSNTANVLLVVGAPAVVSPLSYERGSGRRDSIILLVVSVFFALLCLAGDFNRIAGAALLAGFVILGGYTIRATARVRQEADRVPQKEWVLGLPSRTPMIALFIVAGTVGLPVGANLFVDAAIVVAGQLGVSDVVIGLTIVAVGTSLPELATTVVAAYKRHADVAVGTVMGSCVFNILAIMGLVATVSPTPIPVPRSFLVMDLPIMLLAALLLSFFVWRRQPIGRAAGIMFLVAYAAYVVVLYANS